MAIVWTSAYTEPRPTGFSHQPSQQSEQAEPHEVHDEPHLAFEQQWSSASSSANNAVLGSFDAFGSLFMSSSSPTVLMSASTAGLSAGSSAGACSSAAV